MSCSLESGLLQMGTGFLRGQDSDVAGSEKDFLGVEETSLESGGGI